MAKDFINLAIDFDATIATEKFPDVGALLPGAKKWINHFYDLGYIITIWTCREIGTDDYFKAVKFLADNEIKYHYFNDNSPERQLYFLGQNSRKIGADVYFDDKAFKCTGDNWDEFAEYVETLEVREPIIQSPRVADDTLLELLKDMTFYNLYKRQKRMSKEIAMLSSEYKKCTVKLNEKMAELMGTDE